MSSPKPARAPSAHQLQLPGMEPQLPGLKVRAGFLAPAEQQALLAFIETLDFEEVVLRGVTARRSVVHHGLRYAYGSRQVAPTSEMPDAYLALRERLAALAGVAPGALAEALTTRYPPGAGIGWHRDAPAFGLVAAVSLAAPAVMRFRPAPGGVPVAGAPLVRVPLDPGCAYVIDGDARSGWQHSLAQVKALRYSITFRTLRRPPR